MNKKGVLIEIIVVGVLLVVGFFWFTYQSGLENGLKNESLSDVLKEKVDEYLEECVKVQTTCCPCNMGGVEKCVLKSEVEEYEIDPSDCSENLFCTAMFNCQIESCEYIDGDCVAA